jgi:hypothetical protein
MIDFSKVKLGKKAAKIDPRTLKLANYFTAALPDPAAECDYTFGVTAWGMMLNDRLGDCTIAACGHAEQVWSIARDKSIGSEYTLPDAAILQKYEQWCGYNPSDPSTDQGGIEVDVLNNWRKSGFWEHLLLAYADPNPTDLKHICQAITMFGGVYIGVQLPVSVQGASTWNVSTGDNAIPGSWGGHAVFVPKYRTENGKLIFTAVSWGELVDITEDFWLYSDPNAGPYIDETHALVAPEFMNLKTGTTPVGLNLDQMKEDVLLVAA